MENGLREAQKLPNRYYHISRSQGNLSEFFSFTIVVVGVTFLKVILELPKNVLILNFPIPMAVFVPLVDHFPCENLILLDFSIPRIATILGCESHSQAGLASLKQKNFQWKSFTEKNVHLPFVGSCQTSNCVIHLIVTVNCQLG